MSDNALTTISIITPSFNQGAFLAETIESVISQAGDCALDYIIVDGGSTDDSVAIIKKYAALLQQGAWPIQCRQISFRWLSEPDRGQADALAKGIRMATGEICAWLNSDDTYLPGVLASVSDFFRSNPTAGLLYGAACYGDTAGTIIGSYRTEAFDFDRLASFNFICQPAAFFRRDAYQTVGGLDEALDFAMDYDLWIRIGRAFSCCYLPRVFAMYRLHETSKTMATETLYKNCEESLAVASRHFGWAPLTRIYTSCRVYCQAHLPGLGRSRLLCTVAAIGCALVRSLYLNRGLHRNDLQLLTRENFRKLFKNRLEIMTDHNNDSFPDKP